jgi:ABC-type Mn2+/Zn2+ transport system ATPase subunit
MIDIENLTVKYHHHIALYGANLHIPKGSICGLVGMNGSGKSTLFKAIMGFVPATTGRVLIGGMGVQRAQQLHLVAYMPQSEQVDWQFPVVVEEVVMMGRYGKMNWLRQPSPCDRALVRASLERVGLLSVVDRQIGELSGGQKKRVFMARALAQQSPLLLLDEPFGGVDITTEKSLIELLLDLRHQGYTILISTHNLESISTFCDRTVLINRTILAYGTTQEVFTTENLAKVFLNSPSSAQESVRRTILP